MNFEESRLDRYIKKIYGKNIPQSIIEKALCNKDITLNGEKAKSSDKTLPSDNVFVNPTIERLFASIFCSIDDTPKLQKNYAEHVEDFKRMIMFEDEDLLIINKPSGLAAQLGSKTNIAVDVIAKEYNKELRLVHRIDKETSGITVLAKNIETSRYMLYLFQTKQIQKKYSAIVTGDINVFDDLITITKPLFKDKEKVVVDFEHGKEAITEIKILKRMPKNRLLVSAVPKTGRTHQIRVHLASIDCPIVGDRKYHGQKAKHLFLHASEIKFISPKGKKISMKANFPEYFQV